MRHSSDFIEVMESLFGKRPENEGEPQKMGFEENPRYKDTVKDGIYETVVLHGNRSDALIGQRKAISGVPTVHKDLNLENYRPKTKNQQQLIETMQRYVSFLGKDESKVYPKNGLYIYGKFGTGKTYTTYALANSLIESGLKVLLNTQVVMNQRLRSSELNKDASENEYLAKCIDADVLIIDDIGKQQPTEYQLSNLFTIIDVRTSNIRPTIYTSNYDFTGLQQRLIGKDGDTGTAGSIIDRVFGSTKFIELKGESLRR